MQKLITDFIKVEKKEKEDTTPVWVGSDYKQLTSNEYLKEDLLLNCKAYYIKEFLSQQQSNDLYTTMIKSTRWENRGMRRDTVLYGDAGISYEYGSGNATELVKVWPPVLLPLKKFVEDAVGISFNICLVGYYKNGYKYIGFHSDREEIGKQTPIGSVSIGAERIFEFKGKDVYAYESHKMLLHNGSLLVMGENCQQRYMHSLPMDPTIADGRINFTFRHT